MLLATIENKRKQMIDAAQIYGLSSNQVLKYSQELDKMIDIYQSQASSRAFRPRRRLVPFPFKKNKSPIKVQMLNKAQ